MLCHSMKLFSLAANLTGFCSIAAICAGLVGCASNTTGTSCVASFSTAVATDYITVNEKVTEYAQSFKVLTVSSPGNVQLKLNAVGAPSGPLILKIEADSGAATGPTNVTLETATLDASAVKTTGAAFYNFFFTNPASLTAGSLYWIRLKAGPTSNLSVSNAIQWSGNNSNAFTDGSATLSSDGGANWTNGAISASRDLLFLIGC
jgi:hypothetical protein